MVDDHIFQPAVRGPPLPVPLLPWKNCVAKRKLTRDLTNGKIPLDGRVMNARAVQQTRPEYMLYELEFFAKRLAGMRKQMRQQNNHSNEDAAAYAHDRLLFPTPTHNPNGVLRWEGSEAERWLKTDMATGMNNLMTPQEMYLSRPSYQMFTKKKFTGHIYQENRRRKFVRSYYGR